MRYRNSIITIIAILAIIFGTWKVADYFYSKELNKSVESLRREKIKSSELTQIQKGLYTKLAADTLEIKELKRLNDSLELGLENPEIVTVVKWKLKYLEKPVDGLVVKDSVMKLIASYPDSIKPFVTYNLKVDLKKWEGLGSWEFTEQEIFLGIGQNEDGTYSVNTKVPEYIHISDINVVSLPMAPEKKDYFGVLVGGHIGADFNTSKNFIGLNVGVRVHKFYIGVTAATNNTISGGIQVEL